MQRSEEVVKGMMPLEVNIRSVYALRSCGVGRTGLEKFCGMMNMPTPMTVKNYNVISKNLTNAAKDVALKSMKDATNEAKKYKGCVGDIGISVDGSWQKRGYTSLNGVITAISIDNGKIVDLEVLNRYCKQCDIQHRLLKDNLESLNTWKESHKNICKLNHEGTAPAMEAVGAQRIFERSIEERGVRYTDYYGDGDSKAYSSVRLIYPGITVKKFECIGHYQKRLGTRLLKLKKINKGLSELTKPIIDKLQNYFGIALRDNLSSVEEIRKAIWASFLHIASSEENDFHVQCNILWCQKEKDKLNKTNLYTPGKGLSKDIIKLVKPIYMDLMNPTELAKCLHGKTQNQNESFNAMIWERVPKITYVSKEKLDLAVYDAAVNFNDGRDGTIKIKIFRKLNVNPGHYTSRCFVLNKRRIYAARYKWKDTTKKRRKIIRAQKKLKGHGQKKVEGKT